MIKIQQVNVGEKKTSAKGKDYWQVGIKVDNTWYNGFLNSEKDAEDFKNLDLTIEHDIILFDKPKDDGNGVWKNWKYPSQTDALEQRVADLEKRVSVIERTGEPLDELPAEDTQLPPDDDDLPF